MRGLDSNVLKIQQAHVHSTSICTQGRKSVELSEKGSQICGRSSGSSTKIVHSLSHIPFARFNSGARRVYKCAWGGGGEGAQEGKGSLASCSQRANTKYA